MTICYLINFSCFLSVVYFVEIKTTKTKKYIYKYIGQKYVEDENIFQNKAPYFEKDDLFRLNQSLKLLKKVLVH